jgi:hypothetical protein
MAPTKSPFGRILQELMAARGIETISELGLLTKWAGYRRGMHQAALSKWMSGVSRPTSIPRFCFYLDKALQLTEDEKAAVAASLGRAAYPFVTPAAP